VLANLWSLFVIFVLLTIWLIVYSFNERLRGWVVPTFAVLAIAINLGLIIHRISREETNQYMAEHDTQHAYQYPTTTNTVEVAMTEGMRATVSLPTNGHDPEFMVVVNEYGEIQHSRYNPVTETIDARIRTSGTYTLVENEISFTDIEDKSQLMQNAIRQLTSRGIMQGTIEGYFHPSDPISRTDVVATVIMAFDMLDFDAYTTFTDVSPHAWYYLAIATAEQENLVAGFEDSTFRGQMYIPKDQLVVLSANTLIEQMGYHVPGDIEYFLSDFLDRDELARWSEDGIALSTAANVLIHRVDSMFAPTSTMTRGDAAIILYRVFSRVW